MELKTGQYVRHSKYGWGTVMEYDRHQTLVLFRSIGIKKLQTDSANFAAVGSLAPEKKPEQPRPARPRRAAVSLDN